MGKDNVPETKFELKIHLDDSANDAKPKIKRHTNETYRLTISYRFEQMGRQLSEVKLQISLIKYSLQ